MERMLTMFTFPKPFVERRRQVSQEALAYLWMVDARLWH